MIDETDGLTLVKSDALNAPAKPNIYLVKNKKSLSLQTYNYRSSGLPEYDGATVTLYGRHNQTSNVDSNNRLILDNHVFTISAQARMCFYRDGVNRRPSTHSLYHKNHDYSNKLGLTGSIPIADGNRIGTVDYQIDDGDWIRLASFGASINLNVDYRYHIYWQMGNATFTKSLDVVSTAKITFRVNFDVDLYYSSLTVKSSNW